MSNPQYDIILYGATSFVGQITAHYLSKQVSLNSNLKWAIAGRDASKLKHLQSQLESETHQSLSYLLADALDANALRHLAQQTKVIISTVGPYDLYGETLVRVCAETGTDYCDLTGEASFYHRMLTRYQSLAQETGARIVHCCGFDSIPSDLGVFFLQQQSMKIKKVPCSHIKMRVTRLKGKLSGGTYASMMSLFRSMQEDPSLRKQLANPYFLTLDNAVNHQKQPYHRSVFYDKSSQSWAAPFLMAGINTQVVLRTAALLSKQFGDSLRYDEAIVTGRGASGKRRAWFMTIALGLLVFASSFSPTRWLLEKWFLPKPGQGPSEQEQNEGFYHIKFYGETRDGDSIIAKLTGDQDPGYGSTAKILSQAAICLATDPTIPQAGGFYTPAALMGEPLIKRLVEFSGLTFELVE